MSSSGITGFHIPFTFPDVSFVPTSGSSLRNGGSLLEDSVANSRPTTLQCWDWNLASGGDQSSGIILGCEDGTIYTFHRSAITPPSPKVPKEEKHSSKRSQLSKLSPSASSPSITPPILSPVFSVTAKPRVVSGVTAEQVEAPKNYVDFDDEPDKLKDILQGRAPRDRRSVSENSSADRTPERNVKSSPPSIVEPASAASNKRRGQGMRPPLSSANSREATPHVSPPDSPNVHPSVSFHELAIRYHIIPPHGGAEHAVKSIQLLCDDRFFAVLQENGTLYIYSVDDGSCLATANADEFNQDHHSSAFKEIQGVREAWSWRTLQALYLEDSVVLMVSTDNDNDMPDLTANLADTPTGSSRAVFFALDISLAQVQLRSLGNLSLDGPSSGVGFMQEADGSWSLVSATYDGHFTTRELRTRPPPPSSPVQVGSPKVEHPHDNSNNHNHNHNHNHHTLPIPNPFKSMMSRSSEHLSDKETAPTSPLNGERKMWFSEPNDAGALFEGSAPRGLKMYQYDKGCVYGLSWSSSNLCVFQYATGELSLLYSTPLFGIRDAEWIDEHTFALAFKDRVDTYQGKKVNPDNEKIDSSASSSSALTHFELSRSCPTGSYETIRISSNSFIVTQFSDRSQSIMWHSLVTSQAESSEINIVQPLWESSSRQASQQGLTLTSSLPLELELIIQGYSDGHLRQYTLGQMARKAKKIAISPVSSAKRSNTPLSGHLVGLHTVQNQRTREKYIVGGADDGSIAFWSLSTFELVARWVVFTTPLAKVVQFHSENTGPLRGCALCVSEDGSIAIIVIDGFHFLYLLPGTNATLKRICLGGNNLLLVYSDHRSRLWDAQTKELWRSMSEDKAEELLAQGGWSTLTLENDACVPRTYWKRISQSVAGRDAAATLDLNLEQFVVDAIAVTKTISQSRDEVREILLALDRLRLTLSALLTPGLNEDVESICFGKLGAYPASVLVGFSSLHNHTVIYSPSHPRDHWCLSGRATASRALAILSVLRAMSLFEELTEAANIVSSFFTTSLALCVGPNFKPPSLEYLGQLWFEASNEFRQPIRTLFEATISNLSDEESIKVAEKWQHQVPSLQPDADRETLDAALALFICGSIASDRYSLLSINALMDISKSISLYLHDEKSIYRILAIDLCSRGFSVWHHYIDSMEILRSLFDLATSARKDSISIQNVGAQARLAVISIATNNMPLFMGTLCLDILNPPSVQHRRSVLQVLAFLIRKRPHVLQSHLPRLMEAVVKSLDPNATSDRDVVLDSATEIIGFVVKTFPTVDFHMTSQRLAVGTNEGAVVMYDLKTAIRLYVLEGHKKQITACSFSPDGRRLVTISLKESVVLAWKVGTSFASFFNPGAPPRQGHGGSQPYKTLNFNIGDEAEMTTAEALELVRVEWIADRSVRVKIRQSILTFST